MPEHGRCPWYRRWWHRRLRQIDEATRIPAIIKAAREKSSRPSAARDAFALFIRNPGQRHWRCPCGTRDRHRVQHTLKSPE